jgi:hypothetical protein
MSSKASRAAVLGVLVRKAKLKSHRRREGAGRAADLCASGHTGRAFRFAPLTAK